MTLIEIMDEHEYTITGTPKHWEKGEERLAIDQEALNEVRDTIESLHITSEPKGELGQAFRDGHRVALSSVIKVLGLEAQLQENK